MVIKRYSFFISVFSALFCFSCLLFAQDKNDKIQRIIFEERQIEGKIRRPQLVLIKAEQRPNFSPMIMQSLDSELNIGEYSKGSAVEKSPYKGAFTFDGTKISNFVP